MGSACLSGNSCSSTVDPATVNTVSASPTACSTGQIGCPALLGGGCCDADQVCTTLASKLYCIDQGGGPSLTRSTGSTTGASLSAARSMNTANLAAATSSTTDYGSSGVSGPSSGAKAGIAVGTALGVLLILSVLIAWFTVARKRRERDLVLAGTRPRRAEEVSSIVSSPALHSTGPDYLGQQAQAGPYSYVQNGGGASSGAGLYSCTPIESAVPISPQVPGDITTPVEIAASVAGHDVAGPIGAAGVVQQTAGSSRVAELSQQQQERYELP